MNRFTVFIVMICFTLQTNFTSLERLNYFKDAWTKLFNETHAYR